MEFSVLLSFSGEGLEIVDDYVYMRKAPLKTPSIAVPRAAGVGGGMWRCKESGAPQEGTGAPHPFPHTLPSTSLPCGWSFVSFIASFFDKWVNNEPFSFVP